MLLSCPYSGLTKPRVFSGALHPTRGKRRQREQDGSLCLATQDGPLLLLSAAWHTQTMSSQRNRAQAGWDLNAIFLDNRCPAGLPYPTDCPPARTDQNYLKHQAEPSLHLKSISDLAHYTPSPKHHLFQ